MDKDFDFSAAKPVLAVPTLQRLRVAFKKASKAIWQVFDCDVQETIKAHNTPYDRMRLNQRFACYLPSPNTSFA